MGDLWPEDITKITVKAPLAILQEQAKHLSERTNSLVEGRVITIERSPYLIAFGFSFCIVAPLLGDYTYELFSVYYEVSMYPIKIHLEEDIRGDLKKELPDCKVEKQSNLILAKSEEEFLKILTIIFASRKTRQIVQAILSQSGAKIG